MRGAATPASGHWDAAAETMLLDAKLSSLREGKLTEQRFIATLKREVFPGLTPLQRLNLLKRTGAALGLRPLRAAIYDHTLHLLGGGQKYGLLMAQALRKEYEVTLICSKPVTIGQLQEWYRIDLSGIGLRVIPLSFYEERGLMMIDPALAKNQPANPFHPVARASLDYDLFVNNSMLEMVLPLSPLSVMMVHFPERSYSRFFYADYYQRLICNSIYTAGWINRRWGLDAEEIISPPIEKLGEPDLSAKEQVILSVARFEPGGTKKQYQMLQAFQELLKHPAGRDWKLILAGGSIKENPYLRKVQAKASQFPEGKVELLPNVSREKLSELYNRAAIFWHLCGMGESNPANIEHFGMSTLEAMAMGVVPVVFNGGGQREVVRDSENGFLCNDLNGLLQHTLLLAGSGEQLPGLRVNAIKTAEHYTIENFQARHLRYFRKLTAPYLLERSRDEKDQKKD